MIEANAHPTTIGLLLQAVRAPFLTATAVPVLVGTAISWHEGSAPLGYLGIGLVGLAAIQCGVNVLNDYFDHLTGDDDRYPKPGPFSGGTRLIQAGVLTRTQTFALAAACFALAIGALIFLGLTRGLAAWWLAVAGLLLAVFYSAPPFQLSYVGHGLGELAVGLGFGPIMVLGTCYIAQQRLDASWLWAAIPVGMLIAAVVHINEFPDYRADKDASKKTLVVVLGPSRSVWAYAAWVIGAYVVLGAGIAVGAVPLTALLAFVTFPIAWQCIAGVHRFHSDAAALIPTNAGTIKLHLYFGILVALGYLLAGLLSGL